MSARWARTSDRDELVRWLNSSARCRDCSPALSVFFLFSNALIQVVPLTA